MCKADENVNGTEDATEVKPKKRGAPQNLIPYTPETAKEAAKRAAYCRSLRAQMRKKMLEAVINEGLDKYIVKALKSMDLDQIAVIEKASKLVGLDFASSEEAVQRVDVKADAKVNAKTDTTLNITFKDANNS